MRDDDEEAVERDEFDVVGSGAARIVGVCEGRRSGRGGGMGDGEGERRWSVGVGVEIAGV